MIISRHYLTLYLTLRSCYNHPIQLSGIIIVNKQHIMKKANSLSLSLSNWFANSTNYLNKHQNSHHTGTQHKQLNGFTIVELLVVVVVIGILAAITIVSYTGIQKKAIVASMQSDLSNAQQQLKIYQVTDANGYYPTTIDCSATPAANSICIKSGSGNSFTLTAVNGTTPPTFTLDASNGGMVGTTYRVTNDSSPTLIAGITCPTNFIVVPGSATYGTSDFCVMKYAASHSDATAGAQGTSTTPISAPSVQQWVSVSQTTAASVAPNVAGCTGCHLITEAEYLTIAQNVLNVPSNWSTGTVGSGYIYSGHNDNAPANALVADPSDSNGYAGETNVGGNQRRTLTLSNGQVIWDIAGNIWEWTNGTSTTGQPGISAGSYGWREWTAVTALGTLSPNVFPSGTGLTGASTWNSSKGIGQIYSNADETALRGFFRGGAWNIGSGAGVLSLGLNYAPGYAGSFIGFRVSR